MEECMSILQAQQIREVFNYARNFKNHLFVFCIDDAVITSSYFNRIIKDILYLIDSSIRVLIVAGARNTISAVFKKYNRPIAFQDNRRIIVSENIDLAQMAAFDTSAKILNAFAKYKQTSMIGNWVSARGVGVVNGIDFQYAGVVENLQVDVITQLLSENIIPIFPSIGWSAAGKPYSLESFEQAAKISAIIRADKLFYVMADDPHHMLESLDMNNACVDMNEDNKILRIQQEGIQEILLQNKDKRNSSGYHILDRALYAMQHEVERVHMLDGREDGSLLEEMFSSMGTGIMIYTDEYQAIEPLQESEIEDVWEIMQPLIFKGMLAERTIESLKATYQDYICYKVDGIIYGSAALHRLDHECAEIAGVVVRGNNAKGGVGKKLINYLMEESKRQGYKRVFVLTTKTGDWFESLGFIQTNIDAVPQIRREKYVLQNRKSRVYRIDI